MDLDWLPGSFHSHSPKFQSYLSYYFSFPSSHPSSNTYVLDFQESSFEKKSFLYLEELVNCFKKWLFTIYLPFLNVYTFFPLIWAHINQYSTFLKAIHIENFPLETENSKIFKWWHRKFALKFFQAFYELF